MSLGIGRIDLEAIAEGDDGFVVLSVLQILRPLLEGSLLGGRRIAGAATAREQSKDK